MVEVDAIRQAHVVAGRVLGLDELPVRELQESLAAAELSDGGNETSYIPSALLDYQRSNYLVQFETGAQLGSREAFLQLANGQFVQTQNTTSYYVSLSYRINFNH